MKESIVCSATLWLLEYEMANKMVANTETDSVLSYERPFGLAYSFSVLANALQFPYTVLTSIHEGLYGEALQKAFDSQHLAQIPVTKGIQGTLLAQNDPAKYTTYFQSTGDEYDIRPILSRLQTIEEEPSFFLFNDDFLTEVDTTMQNYISTLHCPIVFAPYLSKIDEKQFRQTLTSSMTLIDLLESHQAYYPDSDPKEVLYDLSKTCKEVITLADKQVFFIENGTLKTSKLVFSQPVNQEVLNIFASSYAISSNISRSMQQKIDFAIDVTNIYMRKKGELTDFDHQDIKQKLTRIIVHG